MKLDEAMGIAHSVAKYPPDPDDLSVSARQSATVIALHAEIERLRAEVSELGGKFVAAAQQRDVIMTALRELCPCSYDPDGPGPLQECPVDGDGRMFVAEVRQLRAVERNAYTLVQSDNPAYAAAANWILTGGAS